MVGVLEQFLVSLLQQNNGGIKVKKILFKTTIGLLLTCAICVSVFICFKQPTTDEVNNLQLFYDNQKISLVEFPYDQDTLLKMYDISKDVFDNDIFFKAFDKTDYLNECKELKNNSNYVLKPQKYFENELYNQAIYYHLKLLLSLNKSDEYYEFFLEYYHCFAGSVESDFNENLFLDDGFKLTKQNVDVITQGYEKALGCCENDVDRFVVLQDLCNFLEKCDEQNETREMFLEQSNKILDEYGRKRFANDYAKWKTFTSEKLKG